MAKKHNDTPNKKGSVIQKKGSMFWPIVLFILALLAFGGVAEENKQEDPCPAAGCKRVPPSEPDVDGTLPPGLDK